MTLPSREVVATVEAAFRITKGALYTYLPSWPEGCRGSIYKVLDFILDVPTYQRKVKVESLEGRDKGLKFTCTFANFASRYTILKGAENDVGRSAEMDG